MTFDRESGVYEALRKDLRKFTPLPRPSGTGNAVDFLSGGGGSGMATVVVAASDSTEDSKANAHFVCDGTNDEEEWGLALNLLLDGEEGRIVACEGTYNFATAVPITTTASTRITIEGLGYPTFNCTAGAFSEAGVTTIGSRVTYKGVRFTGGASGVQMITGKHADLILIDCTFQSVTAKVCVRMSQTGNKGTHVVGCTFANITISGGGGASPNGVFWSDTSGNQIYLMVTASRFENITGAICDMAGSGVQSAIGIGNQFSSATGKREGIWVHNMIDSVHTVGDHTGLSVAGSDSTAIHDNVAAEISAVALKSLLVGADELIIEDSADSYNKKSTTVADITKSAIAFSDSRATLVAGSGNHKWVAPFALEITDVQITAGTVPTGADLIVDVHKNGTTIFTTQANRPTVPAGDADGVGAAATPDVTSMAAGDYLTVDIDQIGSTVAGGFLTVVIEWSL